MLIPFASIALQMPRRNHKDKLQTARNEQIEKKNQIHLSIIELIKFLTNNNNKSNQTSTPIYTHKIRKRMFHFRNVKKISGVIFPNCKNGGLAGFFFEIISQNMCYVKIHRYFDILNDANSLSIFMQFCVCVYFN